MFTFRQDDNQNIPSASSDVLPGPSQPPVSPPPRHPTPSSSQQQPLPMTNPNQRNESAVDDSESNDDYLALQPRDAREYFSLINNDRPNHYSNEASVTEDGYLLPTIDCGEARGAEKQSQYPIPSDCKDVPMADGTTNGASHYINEASITEEGYLVPLQGPDIHEDADPMPRIPNASATIAEAQASHESSHNPIPSNCKPEDASATEAGNIAPVSQELEGVLNLNIPGDAEQNQSHTVSDVKSEDDYLVPKPCRSHSYLELQDVDYDEI